MQVTGMANDHPAGCSCNSKTVPAAKIPPAGSQDMLQLRNFTKDYSC